MAAEGLRYLRKSYRFPILARVRLLLSIFLPAALIGSIIYTGFQLQAALTARTAERDLFLYREALQGQIDALTASESRRTVRSGGGSGRTAAREVMPGGLGILNRDKRSVRGEAELAALDAVEAPLASAGAHITRATLLRLLAEQENNSDFRIDLYCTALNEYGRATVKRPRDSKALMNWANLRQILGTVDCGPALTHGDYRDAITAAVRLDPTDGTAKYAAGLILSWGGEKTLAHALFQEALRYSTQLSERQVAGIFSQVTDGTSLAAIVPARFPRIVDASYFFLKKFPRTFEAKSARSDFESALARLQLQAVKESIRSYQMQAVPFELHVERLERLLPFVQSDGVRKAIDRELAITIADRGQAQLAQYLVARSALRALRVVPGSIPADTRPFRSALARWEGTEQLYLDEFYQSIGGFLGPQQAARSIEIDLSASPNPSILKSLKLLLSDDNISWTEVPGEIAPQILQLGSRWLIVWQLPSRPERYFKITYSNPGRERSVFGNINEMLRVFGNRAVAADPLEEEVS